MYTEKISYFLLLPPEILLKICDYVPPKSLASLASTCRTLRNLLGEDYWRRRSELVLGSNLVSPYMQSRNAVNLNFKQRCIVGQRWSKSTYRTRKVLGYKKCMPCLQLEKMSIIISVRDSICKRNRRPDTGLTTTTTKPHFNYRNTGDVVKIVINGNKVICVSCDGFLTLLEKNDRYETFTERTQLTVDCKFTAVDAKDNIILTGCRNGDVKTWFTSGESEVQMKKRIALNNKVLSLAILPSKDKFVVGMRGTDDVHPLQLFDTERSSLIACCGETFRKGAGILCIYPECENTFLTCSYDTTIRCWDIRDLRRCAASWTEPYDNVIYCVTSDHHVTMLSGANRNGLIHLWDKRHSKILNLQYEVEQKYSPVYSVAFDATQKYAAYETALYQYSYFR